MLKHTNKFIPPRRFAVPLLGLVIAIGAIGQRAQPVFSKQIARLQAQSKSKASKEQTPTYTWIEGDENADVISQSISKEARLRRVLDSSSSQSQSAAARVSPGETYTWMQRNTSSDSEDVVQELESAPTTKASISQEKASINGKIPRKNFPNDDGVFLYGSSQQPGQFGKRYIVFEKQGGKVVGAMYMPSSEFNCFQGTLDRSGEIAMTVKGYAGDISPTQVASRDGLPQDSGLTNYAYAVTLQDYYQLGSIDKNDQGILKSCKANFQ